MFEAFLHLGAEDFIAFSEIIQIKQVSESFEQQMEVNKFYAHSVPLEAGVGKYEAVFKNHDALEDLC